MVTTTALNTTFTLTLNYTSAPCDQWVTITKVIGVSYPAIYFLIGVPLNMANIVSVRNKWKKSSHYVYVIILSVVDSLFLSHRAANAYIPFTPIALTTAGCTWIQFTIQTSSQISSWTLVLLCCERAMVVKFPFSRLTLFNCRRAILSATVVILLISFLNSIVFVAMKAYYESSENVFYCGYREEYIHIMRTVLYKLEAFVYVFVPFVSLLLFNFIIVYSLYKSNGFRNRMKSKQRRETSTKSYSISNSYFDMDKKKPMHPYDSGHHHHDGQSIQQLTPVSVKSLTSSLSSGYGNAKLFVDNDLANVEDRCRVLHVDSYQTPQSSKHDLLLSVQKKMKKRKIKKRNVMTQRSVSVSEKSKKGQEKVARHHISAFDKKLESEIFPFGRRSSSSAFLTKSAMSCIRKTEAAEPATKSTTSTNSTATPVVGDGVNLENIQLHEWSPMDCKYRCSKSLIKSSSITTLTNKSSSSHCHELKLHSQSVTNLANAANVTTESDLQIIFSTPAPFGFNQRISLTEFVAPTCKIKSEPKNLAESTSHRHNDSPATNYNESRTLSANNNYHRGNPYFNQILKSAVMASMVFFITTAPYCVISIFINFIYTPGTYGGNTSFIGFLMTFSVAMCDFNHVTNFFIYSLRSDRGVMATFKALFQKTPRTPFTGNTQASQKKPTFVSMRKKSSSGSGRSSGVRLS